MSNLILGSTQITSVELNWFKRRSLHVLNCGYLVWYMRSSTFEQGLTLIVPVYTQVYKWVPATCLYGFYSLRANKNLWLWLSSRLRKIGQIWMLEVCYFFVFSSPHSQISHILQSWMFANTVLKDKIYLKGPQKRNIFVQKTNLIKLR